MTAPGATASLDEWLAWLPGLSANEIELGLDRVADVYARLSLARPSRVITVAGTNGKGSSVIMLEALFRHRGERAGAYTSPHILTYAERIRVDGRPVGEERIVAAFCRVEAARAGVPLTYFEFGTLAALDVFAAAGVSTAILEVGLGGRLDAVNIVDHDGCLITNVSMDHSDWLGDSIEAIAREKAGVMREARPAVYGATDVPAAIVTRAAEIGADLRVAGRDFTCEVDSDGHWHWQGREVRLDRLSPPALAGRHQIGNAAAVLALLEAMGIADLLDADSVNAAFASLEFPGRQQQVAAQGRRWLLDGAHNVAGAVSLGESIRAGEGKAAVIVLGILADKDAAAIAAELAPVTDRFVCLTPPSSRAIPAADLAAIIASTGDVPVSAEATPELALETAVALTAQDDLIVVAGSFYTLESALRWLGTQ
jgi:dihydrofolate synthase/folylpolyglutamate synthase